jgi:uncharacterized SAM-binding protein YcdF (DUF218 family)
MSRAPLGRRRRLRVFFPVVLFLGLAILTSRWWLPSLGRFLVQADLPAKAPVAVVLAGDNHGYRILRGAQLQRDGLVEKVLVSGVPGIYDLYESDLAIRFAVARGYPEAAFEALHLDYKSTQEEAHVIVSELKRRGIRSVLVVTSDYHTRRAGWIWRYTAPWLEIRMVEAKDRYFRRDHWWVDRESSKRAFDEWMKLIAFTFDFFPPAQSGPVLP